MEAPTIEWFTSRVNPCSLNKPHKLQASYRYCTRPFQQWHTRIVGRIYSLTPVNSSLVLFQLMKTNITENHPFIITETNWEPQQPQTTFSLSSSFRTTNRSANERHEQPLRIFALGIESLGQIVHQWVVWQFSLWNILATMEYVIYRDTPI